MGYINYIENTLATKKGNWLIFENFKKNLNGSHILKIEY
jgi:hypothetical protein